MRRPATPVLVLGGGTNGLGVIRTFGRSGLPVYCVVDTPQDIARYSRYCRGYVVMPGVTRSHAVMNEALTWFQRRVQATAVLFPTSDLAVCHLTQLLPQFPSYAAALPPSDLAEMFVQKPRFYHSLTTLHVPHPHTFDPAEQAVTTILPHVTFPLFLKPASSQLFFQHFHCKGFVAATPTHVQHYLQRAHTAGFHLLLQEIVPGPPHHLIVVKGYINQTGQPQVIFASQNLRQPTPFVDNSCSVSVPLPHVRDVVNQTLHYLAAVQYRGLFIAEWKRDARDQTMKLLEINPRCGGYNSHPVACGVNPLLAAYHDALHQPLPVTTTYRVPVYCIHLLADLRSCLRALWRRQTTLCEILQTYRGATHWLIYAQDDLLPFLHQ